MEDKLIGKTGSGISFNYKTNETKYYLLTGGSGYPLAEFSFYASTEYYGTRLVVPESIPKTANVVPGTG